MREGGREREVPAHGLAQDVWNGDKLVLVLLRWAGEMNAEVYLQRRKKRKP